MANSHYSHKQNSPVRYLLTVVIGLSLLTGWLLRSELWGWISMATLAAVCLLIVLTMTSLTIEEDADALVVRFGPLPVFSTRIPFEDIRTVQATRSRIVDGWGIHYVPGRGWTWSLWGRGCVDIERSHGSMRLGTDDASNLETFLRSRLPRGI